MALSLCETRIDSQGRELVLHGTALFPIACYHDDLTKDMVPWHWHDEMEALVVTEGTAAVTAGTEKYTLQQGEGCFINSGILHAAWNAAHGPCRFHSIVFHPRLVGGIDSIFWQNYVSPLLGNSLLKSVYLDGSQGWHQAVLGAIEDAWQNCTAEPRGYELWVREALSRLVFQLSGHCPVIRQPSEKELRDGERIKTMLQYVQDHYGEELHISQIADSALVSESECLRCFRNTVGMPPIRYVKQFRIQKAAQLLGSTQLKIADIGAKCGFSDISYFTKTFRELKGCTPGEYRKMIE